MFIAAAPYFRHRFEKNGWVAAHYQSSILSVSTVTNLATVLVLAKVQHKADYARRISASLLINIAIFTLLALSTVLLKDATVGTYFGFVMAMVFGASLATGMNQNGVFAYVSGFARQEYTQAIMAGQGVAGVLPCIVQIVSVLAVPPSPQDGAPAALSSASSSSESAFAYFMTATAVSLAALLAFLSLDSRRRRRRSSRRISSSNSVCSSRTAGAAPSDTASATHEQPTAKLSVSLWMLFQKLRWLALAVFICFAATMVFPVFTAEIDSVNYRPGGGPRIYTPAVFIPLALLCWNMGDLLGRMAVLVPQLSLARHPRTLFALALARLGFIPLYLLCNIRGRGPAAVVVQSDLFYLVVVQMAFGLSNGFVGSCCMIGATTADYVSADKREAAGAFMSLMLVAGLAVGSLLSFLVGSSG